MRQDELKNEEPTNPVVIVKYNPRWPLLFKKEQKRILQSIGSFVLAIEHIGSTSVPNLAAKPIIDMLVAIPNVATVDHCIQPLEEIGYEYRGEQGIPGRHFFAKPKIKPRQYHLHMVEYGGNEWKKHLQFRDYLRSHSDALHEYASLKKELAVRYREDREAYTDAKTTIIQSILLKANASQTPESSNDKPENTKTNDR